MSVDKINKTGYLYFHQGWADIINQLALIDYYSEKYSKIVLLMRDDAKPLIDYYVKNKNNVKPFYFKKDSQIPQNILNDSNGEILFHGFHDIYRKNFKKTCNNPNMEHFWKNFYTCYGIDYQNRINYFNLERDYKSEEEQYEKFIKKYGNNYVLYHEDILSPIVRDLKIEKNGNFNYVSLNNCTETFFDYIKILENAKKIELVDSVWATIVYHLDAKYGIFKNIPIIITCLRNHNYMFLEPIKLENWTII